MKKLRHKIEYYSLKSFALAVRQLPLPVARFIARRLADLVFYVIPIRKKVVLDNLTEAFGTSKSADEILRIAHGVYRQFAQTMIELLLFPRINEKKMEKLVRFENLDIVEIAMKMGRGAVMIGAHFGNWELMGAALARHCPLSFVIGQQSNTQVDDLLNSFRLQKGLKLIPLKLSLRGVMKALKNNECIAILSDQDAHEHGTFVDFFGRPASTPKGTALFAMRANCPMIMGHIMRQKDGTFVVRFDTVPRPAPTGDEEKDIQAYTAAYTKILERYTRQYPDHWFWMHRRWKTKPPQQQ